MTSKIGRMVVMLGFVMALGAGCDDLDDELDHTPAAGLGALIVENNTGSDINLYLDGLSRGQVDADDSLAIDLNPGTYRVVLDEDDGDRQYGADVDILEGRLTVMRVYIQSGSYSEYRVNTEFQ
jgi:hypothetical protein